MLTSEKLKYLNKIDDKEGKFEHDAILYSWALIQLYVKHNRKPWKHHHIFMAFSIAIYLSKYQL